MGRCLTGMCKEIYNSKNVDMFEIDILIRSVSTCVIIRDRLRNETENRDLPFYRVN